jgi:hypothetical protein
MRPGINLKVHAHRVRIEIDPSVDVLSFHYEHKDPGTFSLVQQFPLSQATDEDAIWEESSGRFVLASQKKPPSNTVGFRKSASGDTPELVSSVSHTRGELRRAAGDYIFWDDL